MLFPRREEREGEKKAAGRLSLRQLILPPASAFDPGGFSREKERKARGKRTFAGAFLFRTTTARQRAEDLELEGEDFG